MTVEKLLIYIFTMALTTYLVRMLPLVLMKKKIESNFRHKVSDIILKFMKWIVLLLLVM